MNRTLLAATGCALMMNLQPAAAQGTGIATAETLSAAYTGKVYSPYAQRNFPERPLWGDSHLHTDLSMDAGLFGNRLPPREAYRFARGEEVVSSTGQPVRLSRPLDWLVIADHSDGMGLVGDIADGKPELLAYEQAARWGKGLAEGGDAAVKASMDLITTFSQGKMDPEMFALYSPGSKLYKNLWERVIDDAEKFNDPGRFTAFIGFEWTSLIKGNNMHRVVIMRVRFFGGWGFSDQDMNSRMAARVGYRKGVPMGGDLRVRPEDAKAPSFMAFALRDPIGANLDRIQIVKGWMDVKGATHEKVYDIAWSGDRKPDAKGKLPAVGNTVDVANANWTNSIGAAELTVVWTDPDFDPAQKAFYYLRVLEIPTPRWTTYDAFRFGIDLPEGVPTSTQERAYTSPIWYTPKS